MKNNKTLKTIAYCTTLLWIGNHYAMGHLPRLQTVKTEEEIKKFAGKFVVYTTTSTYFGKDKGYSLSNDFTQKYGYIPKNGIAFYVLNQLLKKEDLTNTKTLINEMITQCTLRIRLATHIEEAGIRDIIAADEAKFENMNTHEVMVALVESLTRHKEKEMETATQ